MIALHPSQRLKIIKANRSRRSKDMKCHVAYVCEDRLNSACVLSTKLSELAAFLSKDAQIPQDRISATSLFNIQFVGDAQGRTGGWSKHRWRCRAVPIDRAATVFEALRDEYKDAIVLGDVACVCAQCDGGGPKANV